MTAQAATDRQTLALGRFREHGWWLVLLVPAAASLWLRPLIPPVETRYINVAWEMWSQGHFLVPVLNTESYSDKPPLFFWLIHLGWAIFGVNEWWPRIIPAIFAVINTALAGYLAARLWPDDRRTRDFAVWMLAGTLAWMVFGLALMFDMLLTTCVLVGLIALVQAGETGRRRWHAVFAGAIACGILAKGPVIFLHLLPAALLAPWWLRPEVDRGRWYRRTAGAVAGGILLAGLWVVPAALFGGDAYREKILWKQTAGRMSESFAHARPWWFYLPIFPLLALPWFVWPRAWSGALGLVRMHDRGARFVIAGFVPVFIGFSLVSGKQVHYLLPWLPGVVLLAAAGARAATRDAHAIRMIGPASVWLALPVVAALAIVMLAGGAEAVSPRWAIGCGVAALAGSLAVAFRPVEPAEAVRRLSLAGSASLTLLVVAFGMSPLAARYDVVPVARIIAAEVARGTPLASTSAYNGEFGFYARLTVPVKHVGEFGAPAWCAANPNGMIIDRRDVERPPRPDAVPRYSAPYRGGALRLWACTPGA